MTATYAITAKGRKAIALLEAGGRSVLIDEQEYYVVTAQARGRDAQQLLAQAMARSLRAGRALAMVDLPDEPGAAPFADFIFVDSDQETVHAELGPRGEVLAVEVRHSPSGAAWQTYRGGRKLARALEHRSVEGLSIQGDEDGVFGPLAGVGLRDAWTAERGALPSAFTSPAAAPAQRIDHVLVSADLEVVDVRVPDGPWERWSDHRPVLAELRDRRA